MMYYNLCSILGAFIRALYLKVYEIIKKTRSHQRVETAFFETKNQPFKFLLQIAVLLKKRITINCRNNEVLYIKD